MKFFHSLKRAASEFSEDDCMSSGAAMAYYSIFSLPPLLGLVFMIVSYFGVPREKIEQVVKNQVGIELPASQTESGQSSDSGEGQAGGEQSAGQPDAQHPAEQSVSAQTGPSLTGAPPANQPADNPPAASASEPNTDQPAAGQQATLQKTATQQIAAQAAAAPAAATSPAATSAATTQAATESAAARATSTQQAAQQPAPTQPAAIQQGTNQTAATQQVTSQTAGSQTSASQPAASQQSPAQQASDQPRGTQANGGITSVDERANASKSGGGIVSRIISVALLIFGATGLFAQLQYSLNRAWEVQPDPSQGGIWAFIFKRVLSLGMVVVVLFLLLVSLVLTTVIDSLIAYFQGGATDTLTQVLGVAFNTAATFVVGTLLFAAMFRVLPDAKMAWRDVWVGAAFTSLLFVIGKTALGLYIKNADLGASWGGAAASLIGILIWVYYTSLIVLFGAEFTQVWAKDYGHGIEPARGAVQQPKVATAGGRMSPAR